VRGSLDEGSIVNLMKGVRQLPALAQRALESAAEVKVVAEKFRETRDVFFLGRSGDFPVAMEGALKLKEIAYTRAEGYAAGEMKHGPIALIDNDVLVVGVATDSRVRAKTLSNMQEMKARGAQIVLIAEDGSEQEMGEIADHLLLVPASPDLIGTVTAVIPLQLLAYEIATAKGLDVDKPRNLAKTVTVE
jgi:glucosamine--fructose-6-phosphate aminotransferase (isomerizing)